ncbi:unnamed protein product [Arabidopsis lyrata]|uniref:RING-type domain-containing protein n=1 Tax=Arabidopsis lyrata subsp. lyrata TaxID=81972 RepID=D7KH68_ARALL|nr:E3 ubiquitin-protein ligase rnf8-A [Arabidopsis lyrata subsp. lyrata]EFH69272.1 hypothetical protein ARALYDRAFT_889305 [Arabidopsis lyrata subsp. lyrata]CAH8252774.1 unnamed protein product [Arabidopsis lyrata]|eukprot:XP_002893013.1 E3 ubiquitin-protein ligase rnf8-A [Arabidopsis lyrata subsp. lyrata]
MTSSFTHEIKHTPIPEDVGKIKISVDTTKIYQSISNWDLYQEQKEFSCIPVSLRECIDVEVTEFLTRSGEITPIDAYNVLLDLFRFIDEVTSSDEYTPGCALRVLMTLTIGIPYEKIEDVLGSEDEHYVIFEFDHQTEEAARPQVEDVVQDSFNETVEEEVLGLENEGDVIFDSDHLTEDAARSQFVEVFRISLNEISEEEDLGLEDEHDVNLSYEEAALSYLEEVVQVSHNETVGENVLGLEDELYHQIEEEARSLSEISRFSLSETIEEETIGYEDDYDANFSHEEATPSQLGEFVPFYGLSRLLVHHDASFDFDHQTEEAFRSRIAEVSRVSFNETNTVRLKPASKFVVGSLNRKIYKKARDVVVENAMCTICLEEFDDGRSIVTLPCGHEFDEECIEEWFVRNHICPLCRFELPHER